MKYLTILLSLMFSLPMEAKTLYLRKGDFVQGIFGTTAS